MRTIREALKSIKAIQGIRTDDELANNLDVSVHTLRNWIQNDSIRRKLLEYCFNNKISIDEVFFGEIVFSKDRCENCKKKSICSVYRDKQSIPVTIEQTEEELHLEIETKEKKQFSYTLHNKNTSISDFSTQIKDADKISILIT